MRTFIVEGSNWRQRIETDDSVYGKYSDMAAEAMTLAIQRINNGKAENLMEEFADELLGVGPEMTAWAEDDGTANEKRTGGTLRGKLRELKWLIASVDRV